MQSSQSTGFAWRTALFLFFVLIHIQITSFCLIRSDLQTKRKESNNKDPIKAEYISHLQCLFMSFSQKEDISSDMSPIVFSFYVCSRMLHLFHSKYILILFPYLLRMFLSDWILYMHLPQHALRSYVSSQGIHPLLLQNLSD